MIGLTIILPSNNKEVLNKIKPLMDRNDELLIFHSSSKNIKNRINHNVLKSHNNDILLLNPKDPIIFKGNNLDVFREEGKCFVVNNVHPEKIVGIKSSLKFNKSDYSLFDGNCRNLTEFINKLRDTFSSNGLTQVLTNEKPNNVVNRSSKLPQPKIEIVTDKEDDVQRVFFEETTPTKSLPEKNTTKSWRSKSKKRPKILLISDVKGWAWWLKSEYLKYYLKDEFDIDIVNVIGEGKKSIPKDEYDLYFTYGWSYINRIKHVPFKKRITGLTAHRNLKILQGKLKMACALHANSKLLMKEAKQVHNNVFYVPNGVDPNLFYKHQESDILDRDTINIGHVGKMAKLKQQKTVIEPVIQKLGNSYKYLSHYSNYTNKIKHTEMPQLYQNMDLFIVASLEDGTPNPALESMACEIPVISNKIGNMPEIIINGYNGYLVDNPTIDNYVNLINSLDKEHILQMGKNARQTILNGWTWEIQAENYRYMFNKILGRI